MLDKIKSKFEMTEEQKVEAVKAAKRIAATVAVGITVNVAVHYGSKAIIAKIDDVRNEEVILED